MSKSNQRNGERHRDLLYSVIWSAFVETRKKILHPLHSIKRLFLKRIERTTLLLATLDYNLKKKDLKRTSLL